MPLSRLENFLKNVEGNILYVNPTDLDATDSIENQGNSLTRPFKSIQRALLEAARFSYQIGQNNDKFNRTTILLYPGTHEVDNRPGYNVINSSGAALYRDRNGVIKALEQLTDESNYNINDPTNELYKYNSTEGGVIIPRGTSIVGLDLRKTNIRPKFVPDPTNDGILRSAIFRVTGGCYFWQFTIFDGDPNSSVYRDYTTNRYTPRFSHHKLTVFEYADGVNGVGIGTSTSSTDLQMYYHKVQKAYGDSSGRAIGDFPSTADMQPKLPEYEMVGPVAASNIGITSMRAGAGSLSNTSTTVTVDCKTAHSLVVDSSVRISGVNTYPNIYNGNFVVTGVSSDRIFTYRTSSPPLDGLPAMDGDEQVIADTDTITGTSPYIFNCSLRSVYGMCGMHADGSKSTGFKSMVVAQYTGVGLQKDNDAFLLYNSSTAQYDTNATVADSEKPLYLNSNAIYRPSYENYHVKCSNKAVIQIVSVFAIGYAQQFLAESGGDQSITNSNSNFGSKALKASGFQDQAFVRDDKGYVTHIIPPQRLEKENKSVEWSAINVGLTTAPVGVGTTAKIFLDGFTDPDIPPPVIIEGFRIGAKRTFDPQNLCTNPDLLKVNVAGVGTYSAPITMINSDGSEGPTALKEYVVGFVGAANSITSSTLTLRQDHQLFAGESIRVIADDGALPDGVDSGKIYYAVTNDSQNETLNANQIKLAKTENEAILGGSGNFIVISNDKGGRIRINSRVTDKLPGDFAHPVQYDTTNKNWYVRCSIDPAINTVWSGITTNQDALGPRTNKTFFERREDTRSLGNRIYKLRYVIPKEEQDARPPIPGYVVQESSTTGVTTATDFTDNIPNATVLRNVRIINTVNRDSNTGITTICTEKPHDLMVGDRVLFKNIRSTANTVGAANTGYNTIRNVVGVTSSKGFEVSYGYAPGNFITNVSTRNSSLPTFSKQQAKGTFVVYRVETLKEQQYNKQDGVYHLICVDSSISPTVNEFSNRKYTQAIENLYPQFDGDNFVMDASAASSYAINDPVGKVVTNSLQYSITREFANRYIRSFGPGIAITYAAGSTAGVSTIYTDREHNLNQITAVSIGNSGVNYGAGISTTLYNATLSYVGVSTGEGATANITIDALGGITAISIVDGGSAYGVGHTLEVVGVQTAGSHTRGWVNVTKIANNIGDAIEIVGVGTSLGRYTSGYCGIHTIVSLKPKEVTYNNGFNPGVYDVNTVGMASGFMLYAGPVPPVSTISYSSAATGIATVTTSGPHGLNVNNPFKIVGVAQTIYNTESIVNERISTTQFNFKFTDKAIPATYTAGGSVIPINYGPRGGKTESGNERIAQRLVPFRTGIQTSMSAASINSTTTTLTLGDSSGFYKGDYVQIDGEVIRISSDFSSNQATVIRGQLGSRSSAHDASSLVKKIRIIASEKRRHSILRASGHTFEYVGYGPGNYSTGLPQKQDRILSKEEQFLSQSQNPDGGAVVYTGVNDAGDFYIGNKVINSKDGTESTFNIPIPTVTGADEDAAGAATRLDAIFDSVTVREGLSVDGDNNTTVKLNAPTTITEKLTTTSADGAEFVKITINGGLPENRTFTYSPTKPTGTGTLGDLTFNSSPNFGEYLGWTYTNQGWKRFGLISAEADSTKLSLGTVGVGSTSANRIGQQNGIDVRGTIVADAFVCAGICTFSGSTTFASITFSELTVGVATVTGRLDINGDFDCGIATVTTLKLANSDKILMGDSDFLEIYHDGSDAYFKNTGGTGGRTYIQGPSSGGQEMRLQAKAGEDGIVINDGGAITIGHAGSTKIETSATGITVTGTINGSIEYSNGVLTDTNSANTDYQVGFVTAASGTYNRLFIDSQSSAFTYNPSSNTLSAGTFNGSGASLTNIPNSATTATDSNNGNTIVGRDASGNFSAGTITATLSGNASSASLVDVNANNTANETVYPVFVDSTGSAVQLERDTGLTYNPSTQILTCTTVSAGLNGIASDADQIRVRNASNSPNSDCHITFRKNDNTDSYDDLWTDDYLVYNPSGNVFAINSDEKLKDNIEVIPNALDKVKQIRGVTFNWKRDGVKSTGVIAQDVEKAFPVLVSEREKSGDKSVAYQNMVGLLVEAIKEQQIQIEDLKAKVEDLSK